MNLFRWNRLFLVGFLVVFVVSLSACSAGVSETKTVECQGKTVVLIEDAVLTNGYSHVQHDGGVFTWEDWEEDSEPFNLVRGSIVLMLDQEGEMARVYIPTGDAPGSVYGNVPLESLSQEPEDLAQANIAMVNECMTYRSADGEEAGKVSGGVSILDRVEGWCRIVPWVGGDTRVVWIPEENLSYDFDSIVLDRESKWK